MNLTKSFYILIFLSGAFLSGCGPSQEELDAQSTQVAESIYSTQTQIAVEIFQTQTAAIPTFTPSPTFTRTTTSTPTNTLVPMELYESDKYPFAIEIPGTWERFPDQFGITASFGDATGGMSVMIAEEDLNEIGTGALTLDEYTDLIIFNISGVDNFEVIGREKTVSANGLPILILEASFGPNGLYRTKRLIYIHEDTLAFNATYLAFKENYADLQPLIDQSFASFQVVE